MNRSNFLFLALTLFSVPASCKFSFADISISMPATKLKSCDDLATQKFNDPWDMSNTADVNNYFQGFDVREMTASFSGTGTFDGTITGVNPVFHLFSSEPCLGYAIGGRWGQRFSFPKEKYHYMVVKMHSDRSDPLGLHFLWDRDCASYAQFTVTSPYQLPVYSGWNTYAADFNSIDINNGYAAYQRPWLSGDPINALGIMPAFASGLNFKVDAVRLVDPTSCSGETASVPYTANPEAGKNLFSLALTDGANPFQEGVAQVLVAGEQAVGDGATALNGTQNLFPGSYRVVGVLDSDFATLERFNPWDMNDLGDLASLPAGATRADGILSGPSGTVELNVGRGISAAKYNKFTLKGGPTGGGQFKLLFRTVASPWADSEILLSNSDLVAAGRYNRNLSLNPQWSGTVTQLKLSFTAPYTVDFVSIRNSGYDTEREGETLFSSLEFSANHIVVNSPPLVSIQSPNDKGGEAYAPWNMQPGDIQAIDNLLLTPDPKYPGETLTAYLPDVRTVEGLRGDFFKGTNVEGIWDPVNASVFPTHQNPPLYADVYHNLCFKLFHDMVFDPNHWNIARAVYRRTGAAGGFFGGYDMTLIYDGWSNSRWYEYCVDLKNVPVEETDQPEWGGQIDVFRVDANEITESTSYYFDYIKLRKDNVARGREAIAWRALDLDDPDVSISFSYSSTADSVGNHIATVPMNSNSRVYLWDTSSVPPGQYFVHAIADDGRNTTTRLTNAKVIVEAPGAEDEAPVLSLEAPIEGATYCQNVQLKGFALNPSLIEDLAAVEVWIDGALQPAIHPSLYSPQARASYPQADSSNSGFNTSYDIANLPSGAHSLTAVAYTKRGKTSTVVRKWEKGGENCAPEISDPPPSGAPAILTPVPSAPTPAPGTLRVVSLKHSKKNQVTFQVRGLTSSFAGCQLEVRAGLGKKKLSLAKSFPLTAPMVNTGKASLSAGKVKVGPALQRSKLFVQAKVRCRSGDTSTAVAKTALSAGNKGAADAKGVIAALRKLTLK